MANSSILGGQAAPSRPDGNDIDALGPSDSSDSGSDVQGERSMPTVPDNPGELGALPVDGGNDSDAAGSGERGSATGNDRGANADILPDRIVADPAAASQGGGDTRRRNGSADPGAADDLPQDEADGNDGDADSGDSGDSGDGGGGNGGD